MQTTDGAKMSLYSEDWSKAPCSLGITNLVQMDSQNTEKGELASP